MEKVRLGLIGTRFAALLHINGLAKLRGSKVDVVAVASKTKEHAATFAKKFDIPDYYDDYRQILERKDIDVVDLCIPTDFHEEFSIEAAEAGKHIICEKPLTGYFGKERKEEQVGFAVSKKFDAQGGDERMRSGHQSGEEEQGKIHVCGKLDLCPSLHQTEKLDQSKRRNDPGDPGRGKSFGLPCQIFKEMEDLRRGSLDAIGAPIRWEGFSISNTMKEC